MGSKAAPRWPLVCAVVAVAVYARTAANGFVLDDVRLVAENPSVAALAHLPRLFLEPYWNVPGENYGLYRPLTIASFAIGRALFGPGPIGAHLVNVALHGAVTFLAWFAMRRAGAHYGTALVGSLLFAVLPIHAEAVSNIAGRAELLAALFVLLAWMAHRRAMDGRAPSLRWPALAAGAYLAATLSKESALLAPLLYLADDAREGTSRGRRAALIVGYAAAGCWLAMLRIAALGTHQLAESTIALDNPAAAAGIWPRVATALWVQVKYASSCLAPVRLVSDYSYDAIPVVRSAGDPRFLTGALFVALVVAAAWWGFRRSRPVALAASCWLLFFLPSGNLVFPAGTIMAERLAYLPSFGFCLLLGHIAARAAAPASPPGRSRARAVGVAVAVGVVVAAYGTRTVVRTRDWKSNLTLALADVASMPRSAKLQAGAGMFLEEAGRADEAEAHLRRAVEIYPEYAQMHYNLGVLLARRGAHDEAVLHLRRAAELAPDNPLPRRMLEKLTH